MVRRSPSSGAEGIGSEFGGRSGVEGNGIELAGIDDNGGVESGGGAEESGSGAEESGGGAGSDGGGESGGVVASGGGAGSDGGAVNGGGESGDDNGGSGVESGGNASNGAGIVSNPPNPLGAVNRVSEVGEESGIGGSSTFVSNGLIDSTIDSYEGIEGITSVGVSIDGEVTAAGGETIGASTGSNKVSGGPTRVTKSRDDEEDPIAVFGTSIAVIDSSTRVTNAEGSFRSDCGQYGQC
jgi:hypothetical protein